MPFVVVTNIVPLLTCGHEVAVDVAFPAIPGPAKTVVVKVPVQPVTSLIITV